MQIGIASFAAAYDDASQAPSPAQRLAEPAEVAEKILHHDEALGGISRITFQMNASSLPHAKLMRSIELLGTRVAPIVRKALAAKGG